MSAAIEASGLGRRFGRAWAVRDLDLTVPAGGVTAFLGANGAGKTTTIRMLLGLLRPDSGDVRLFGAEVRGARREALSGVGALVETPSLYAHLSGRENLEHTRRLLGLPRAQVDAVLDEVRLTADAGRPAGQYSLGMKQRLGLARALLGEPRLLVLDEPTNGLDPAGIREMRQLVRRLGTKAGTTVFLSSHLLAEVEQVADRVAVLARGRLRFAGSVEELKRRSRPRLAVGVDRPEPAVEALRGAAWKVILRPDGLLEVGLGAEAASDEERREAAASLAEALSAGGFRLHHLAEERPTLEEAFLHLTAEGEGEGE